MDTIEEQQQGAVAQDAQSSQQPPQGSQALEEASQNAPVGEENGSQGGRPGTPEAADGSSADFDEDVPAPELEGSVGLGVDLVKIARMKQILARTPSFATRVYTEGERAYCQSTAQPHIHYATRFAAKEAVLKALGTGFAFGIAPADVEVVRNQHGRPSVRLHRKAAEVAREQGVREIPVSLSYTHDEAVACAMAITAESVRVAEERVDPMEELSKQFKEARSLLDDLPVRKEGGETVGELPPVADFPLGADAEDGEAAGPVPQEWGGTDSEADESEVLFAPGDSLKEPGSEEG